MLAGDSSHEDDFPGWAEQRAVKALSGFMVSDSAVVGRVI